MSDDCQCPVCGRMHRYLGTPPLSVSEQIARDMKQGTFPQKSKDTLLEEAAVRIEALEVALRKIALFADSADDMDDDPLDLAIGIARAALAPEQDK